MTLHLILMSYLALGLVVNSFLGWLEFLRLHKEWKQYKSTDPTLRDLFALWIPWDSVRYEDKFLFIFVVWVGWPALVVRLAFQTVTNWISKSFESLVNTPISLGKKKRQQLSLEEVDDLIFHEEQQHQESRK